MNWALHTHTHTHTHTHIPRHTHTHTHTHIQCLWVLWRCLRCFSLQYPSWATQHLEQLVQAALLKIGVEPHNWCMFQKLCFVSHTHARTPTHTHTHTDTLSQKSHISHLRHFRAMTLHNRCGGITMWGMRHLIPNTIYHSCHGGYYVPSENSAQCSWFSCYLQ